MGTQALSVRDLAGPFEAVCAGCGRSLSRYQVRQGGGLTSPDRSTLWALEGAVRGEGSRIVQLAGADRPVLVPKRLRGPRTQRRLVREWCERPLVPATGLYVKRVCDCGDGPRVREATIGWMPVTMFDGRPVVAF